jgi:hypothetical protein
MSASWRVYVSEVAPEIGVNVPPADEERSHSYVEPDSGSLFGSEKVYVPVRTWPLVVVPVIATFDADGTPAEAVMKV